MEFVRFALLGLGAGGLYALAAQGIVLIYRGSGVINFAQGAMGLVIAYTYYDLRDSSDWPWYSAMLTCIAMGAAMGVLMHLLIMRPLRKATVLSRDDRDARRAAVPPRARVAAMDLGRARRAGRTCLAASSTRSPTPTSARPSSTSSSPPSC